MEKTKKRVNFILGSHNHLPFGTTDDEFEKNYREKLKPFISALNKYPQIPAVLHYSGVLLYWLERAHPEFLMLLADMISRKQIELLGGGFYEPMFPLIPPSDKIGQIELLTTYLRKQFGKRPLGCRLPAFAWEQNLVSALNNCGMLYTFLNGEQFSLAGLSDNAPCITEDQGKILTVFPISTRLNALFAQQRASLVMENLLAQTSMMDEKSILCVFPEQVFMESGEQAPDITYQIFFEDISRFEKTVNFTAPFKIYNTLTGLKKAYFPPCLSLSLQPEYTRRRQLKRQFDLSRQSLIDYPEANYLYSKMMFTHVLINQLHGDKSRKRTAREELWKAQGYDAFCPTSGGGIYRHSVRKAAYRVLLEAEKISREKGVFTPSLMAFDFDLDGKEEYLFQEEYINCYIKTLGADVFELDYLPKSWNYLDTFSLSARTNPCKRASWTDILAPREIFEATFADRIGEIKMQTAQTGFLEGGPGENAFRFCKNEIFEVLEMDKTHGKLSFRLPVNAAVPYGNIEIEKTYQLKKSVLSIHYTLVNKGANNETFTFIPSVDLSFPGEGDAFLRIYKLNTDVKETISIGEVVERVQGIKFQDIKNEVIIIIASDKLFDAYILPVRTPCSIEGETIDMYQSTNIMPIKQVSLVPDERFETEFSMRMYH
ncbi:MAG: DUF1926 domain-containing protein [Treponema sp.]|jgi:hypothetical protein|nr:DUF1926 domain-containing protein [Treponema sp.]